jgi:exo-beta-1,3-glucanase (GH17 family)
MGASTGENWEHFDGYIIGNEAVNWRLCGWTKLVGRVDGVSLDCWG